MSNETRKDGVASEGEGPVTSGKSGDVPGQGELPDREKVMPKDHELYTPQGGGAGTGAGPIREVAAVEDAPTPSLPKEAEALPLSQVGPEVATAEALGLVEGAEGGEVVGGIPERPEVSSFRLLSTLAVAGAIAGALLVFVFLWSDPLIQAERARVLQEAVTEVLKGPDRYESVFLLQDSTLSTQLPEGVDSLDQTQVLDKVYLGYGETGNPVGFAMASEGFGFQDIISVIFGYDPVTGQLLGMKVLGHKETPGLGDKIVKDSVFVAEFDGVNSPIVGVKPSRATGDPDQVVTITGVTISSVAVIRIINERIAEMAELLAAYDPGGGDATGVATGVSNGVGTTGESAGGEEEGR
jgi:electron transport complex protein RnfG